MLSNATSMTIADLNSPMNLSGVHNLNALLPVFQNNQTVNWFNFTILGEAFVPYETVEMPYAISFEHDSIYNEAITEDWLKRNAQTIEKQVKELMSGAARKLPKVILNKALNKVLAIYQDENKSLKQRWEDLLHLTQELYFKTNKQGEYLSVKYPYMTSIMMSYVYDLAYQHEQRFKEPLVFFHDMNKPIKTLIQQHNIHKSDELINLGYCRAFMKRNNFFSMNLKDFPENKPVSIEGQMSFDLAEDKSIHNLFANLKIKGDDLNLKVDEPEVKQSNKRRARSKVQL